MIQHIEIHRMANGYSLVIDPQWDRGVCSRPQETFVFNSLHDLTQKVQELFGATE
jgi:hypothetical protein